MTEIFEISEGFDWAKEVDCAVTVCDNDGKVIYQNDKSLETFAASGDMRGRNLMPCHNERSRGIIARLLTEGGVNAYTITKKGKRKLIYQTPWRRDGKICGLVELSIVLPEDMPHYDRDKGE